MSTSMEQLDTMWRDAEQTQDQIQAGESLEVAETLSITGVQLNEASQMVFLYHKETGEPRQMPRLMAQVALRKRFRRNHPMAGEFMFSVRPTKTYHQGQVKCWLHPDRPERPMYDQWGLPVCDSAHLPSEGEAVNHMRKRHPSANAIIQERKQEEERKQGQESNQVLARAVLEAIRGQGRPEPVPVPGMTEEAPLYVRPHARAQPKKGVKKAKR